MSSTAFLLVVTLASAAVESISDSFPSCISCPCGASSKNYTHCIDDSLREYLTCDFWSHCQTCESNATLCITCPPDRFGPTCSKMEMKTTMCADPGIPRNGSRLNPDGSNAFYPRVFEEGESVIFACNGDSFALHGTSFITCLADGNWSAPGPRCITSRIVGRQRATCDDPGIPREGSRLNPDGSDASYPRIFEEGESVNFTCNGENSTLKGTNYIICLANGTWSDSRPRCINSLIVEMRTATCADPGIPIDGSRLNPDGSNAFYPRVFEEGESVVFTCNGESFALHGASFITCLVDGIWSAPRPRCINSRMDYYCADPGFILDGSRANADGNKPPPSSMYHPGQSVMYSCHEGFELIGNSTLTCSSFGLWSSFRPFCVRKFFSGHSSKDISGYPTSFCPLPRHLNQGSYAKADGGIAGPTSKYKIGQLIVYSCNDGYELEGNSTSTCLPSGWWPKYPPLCRKLFSFTNTTTGISGYFTYPCFAPKYFNHGSYANADGSNVSTTSKYKIGQSIVYSCNDGYELLGNSTSICLPTGWWSKYPPICRKIFSFTNTAMADHPQSCPLPEVNPDVEIEEYFDLDSRTLPEFEPGDKLTFSCKESHALEGPSVIECLGNGRWSSSPPTCNSNSNISNAYCPDPIYVENGSSVDADSRLSLPSSKYTRGQSVLYSCDEGFEPVGNTTLTCLPSGSWSSPPPFCRQIFFAITRPIDAGCPDPGITPGGLMTYASNINSPPSSMFHQGQSVMYSCRDGFELFENSTLTCSSFGLWSSYRPFCMPYMFTSEGAEVGYCSDPGFVPFGSRFNADGSYSLPPSKYNIGEAVVYSCNEGYELDGNSILTCLSPGWWSSFSPICTEIFISRNTTTGVYCPDPGYINNGLRINEDGNPSSSSSRYREGQSVSYSCNKAYELVGNSRLTCSQSLSWSSNTPYCLQIFFVLTRPTDAYCHDPGYTLNGLRTNTDGSNPLPFSMYRQGQSVVYLCHEGFELIGNRTLICSSFGLWTNYRPLCVAKLLSSNSVKVFSTYPADTPSVKDCPVPEMDPNSEVKEFLLDLRTVAESFEPGSELNFRCKEGYDLEGPERIVCERGGWWSDLSPKCIVRPHSTFSTYPAAPSVIDCPVPEMDPNSEVKEFLLDQRTVAESFEPGSELNFRCKDGYYLVGPVRIVCQMGGWWSDLSPKCKVRPPSREHCSDPGYIRDGSRTKANGSSSLPSSKYSIGQSVFYSCDKGYELVGNSTLTCLPSLKWSSFPPLCRKSFSLSNTTTD
ncbi:unnamed protein product [Larinioides sclopetarius]|uniref:Sushi domain-containing protein n=1 Tax=Larinioides sclopetarius TaxID=280406 RepID=A0AAV2A440_9ARAC